MICGVVLNKIKQILDSKSKQHAQTLYQIVLNFHLSVRCVFCCISEVIKRNVSLQSYTFLNISQVARIAYKSLNSVVENILSKYRLRRVLVLFGTEETFSGGADVSTCKA